MLPALDRLERAIAVHAPWPALREGDRSVGYAALQAHVQRRTARLLALGAQRVGLALDNGIDWALWDLALAFGAQVCIPLAAFFSDSQYRHVIDSAGIDTLVGAGEHFEAQAHGAGFARIEPGLWHRRVPAPPPLPAGTRKITFTSGTTGRPKGVCLDTGTQWDVAEALRDAIAPSGVRRHLCVLPLATLLENIAGIYAPLLAGACVELRPVSEIGLHGASGFDPMRFVRTLNESRPHSLILVPQLLQALVAAAESGASLPDSLRFIAVGGARVSPGLLHRAEALGLPVYEGYGLSECASVVCLNTTQAQRVGTVGRPLGHVRIRLAGDGEVLVRGPRMLGYLGEAAPGGEWLATGDLGRLENGFLLLQGRRKNQFITAFGRNVDPEWVESELTMQPAIAQAWLHGEAQAENVAVLVARHASTSDASLEAAVAAVNRALPDYARVHRWLRATQRFDATNGLATENGRLRRDALWARYGAAIAARLAQRLPFESTDGIHP